MDVTGEHSMKEGVAAILAEAGRIDVLVNNAGYGSYGAIEDVDIDEGRRQFEVNVFGAMNLVQLVLPQMRAQTSGTIVNITSMGGKIYTRSAGGPTARSPRSKHSATACGWSSRRSASTSSSSSRAG